MKILRGLALLVAVLPISSWAATFSGEVYSHFQQNNVTTARDYISTTSDTPVVEFTSEDVPFFGVLSLFTGNVGDALDTQDQTLTGNAAQSTNNTVWHITGFVDLTAGLHTLTASYNDGVSLLIGGQEVHSSATQGFTTNKSFSLAQGGVQSFDLLYWNNASGARLNFKIDGANISAAPPPTTAPPQNNPLPAPASLSLALVGLAGLAFRRRSR